jgi:hypothetical protein
MNVEVIHEMRELFLLFPTLQRNLVHLYYKSNYSSHETSHAAAIIFFCRPIYPPTYLSSAYTFVC